MALKIAREDEAFMSFQKKIYDDFNEQTRLETLTAAKITDVDLKAHLEQLDAHHLKGKEFSSYPKKDIPANLDFVEDLLVRYLQDIKTRQKKGQFGMATAATLLRKVTKLEDIDEIIDNLQKKASDLLSNAEKQAKKLAEEAIQREVD